MARGAALGCMVLLAVGCGSEGLDGHEPRGESGRGGASGFVIVSLRLADFDVRDRNRDGQPNNLPPQEQLEELADYLSGLNADVLLLQGLGGKPVLDKLLNALDGRQKHFPHVAMPAAGHSVAMLSRHPMTDALFVQPTYRANGQDCTLQQGIWAVELMPPDESLPLRLVTSSLKDKTFDPAGQTERRRSEARLLQQQLAAWRTQGHNVIFVGCLQDTPDSAAVRALTESGWRDLHPRNEQGIGWTWGEQDAGWWARLDYVLVPEMTEHRDMPRATVEAPFMTGTIATRALSIRLSAP